MTHDQHKARLMTGGLSGTAILENDADIINHFTENTTSFSKAVSVLGNRGYNAISLKSRLHPAQLGGFVLPSNNGAMRSHMRSCTRTALGVWAIGNDPAVRDGESTPTLTGGFQSQILGGQHG